MGVVRLGKEALGRLVALVLTCICLAVPATATALEYEYLGTISGAAEAGSLAALSHFGVAVDPSGRVYTTDFAVTGASLRAQIKVYSSYGDGSQQIRTFGSYNPVAADGLVMPMSIAIDPNGVVYVGDFFGRIQVFDSFENGNGYLRSIGGIGSPLGTLSVFGLATDSAGRLYTTEYTNNRVRVYSNYSDGNSLTGDIATAGSGNGQVNLPMSVAIDTGGYPYVTDSLNLRVQAFEPFAAGLGFKTSFNEAGSGKIVVPTGVAVDGSNRVHVVDAGNSSIQVYSPLAEGNGLLTSFGSKGNGNDQFSSPFTVAAYQDLVYVGDVGNSRIQILRLGSGNRKKSELSLDLNSGSRASAASSGSRVCYLCKVSVGGRLKEKGGGGIATATVAVQRRSLTSGSDWQTIKEDTTSSSGRYSVSVKPKSSQRYRAVFTGNSAYGSASKTVTGYMQDSGTIKVRKVGPALLITGKIKSVVPQRKEKRTPAKLVQLEFNRPAEGRGWRTFRLVRPNSRTGKYRFKITPKGPGLIKFRAEILHDYDLRYVNTYTRTVTVSYTG